MEFLSKIIDNVLGKSKLNFWTNNDNFEQCVLIVFFVSKLIFVSSETSFEKDIYVVTIKEVR